VTARRAVSHARHSQHLRSAGQSATSGDASLGSLVGRRPRMGRGWGWCGRWRRSTPRWPMRRRRAPPSTWLRLAIGLCRGRSADRCALARRDGGARPGPPSSGPACSPPSSRRWPIRSCGRGADYSRAAAELALALDAAHPAPSRPRRVSRTALARALGAAGQRIEISPGRLLQPAREHQCCGAKESRGSRKRNAIVRTSQARKRAVELQYLPRPRSAGRPLGARAAACRRASAPAQAQASFPTRPTGAAEVCLTWPALELVAVRGPARRVRGGAG